MILYWSNRRTSPIRVRVTCFRGSWCTITDTDWTQAPSWSWGEKGRDRGQWGRGQQSLPRTGTPSQAEQHIQSVGQGPAGAFIFTGRGSDWRRSGTGRGGTSRSRSHSDISGCQGEQSRGPPDGLRLASPQSLDFGLWGRRSVAVSMGHILHCTGTQEMQ